MVKFQVRCSLWAMLRSFSKLASPARGVSMTMLQWLDGARTPPSTFMCIQQSWSSIICVVTNKNRLKFSHKLSRRLGYVFYYFYLQHSVSWKISRLTKILYTLLLWLIQATWHLTEEHSAECSFVTKSMYLSSQCTSAECHRIVFDELNLKFNFLQQACYLLIGPFQKAVT